MLYNYTADLTKKNAPNQADNIVIFRSCLQPKMRLSVVLEGRYIGYQFAYQMSSVWCKSTEYFSAVWTQMRFFDSFFVKWWHGNQFCEGKGFVGYGNTGCWVFKRGCKIGKLLFLKINVPKGNYWILRIGVMGRCQRLDIIWENKVI